MPTVTKAASSHTTVTTGWTNPSNAFSTTGDNTYATAAPGKNATINGDFFFPNFTTGDIPDGSVINSWTITVEWGMTAAVTGGTLGTQMRNNGTNLGTEITQTSTTEVQATQTGTTGISLSDLRSASTLLAARTRCSKGNTTNAMTGNLDFVSLTIDYTPPIIPPKTQTKATTAAIDKAYKIHAYPGAVTLMGVLPVGPIQGTSAITLPMLTWTSAGSATGGELPAGSGQFFKRQSKNRRRGAFLISGAVFINTEDQGQANITLPMLTWSMAGTTAVATAPIKPITQVKARPKLTSGGVTQLGQAPVNPVQTGGVNITLPMLTWNMTGILPGNTIGITLPMLTWQSSGEVTEDSAFFWMNVWKAQREKNRGKVTLITPTRQVVVGNIGTVTLNLPMLTWASQDAGSNSGQLLITLPMLTWSSQAALPINGQIAITLPMLTWNMADANATQGTINVQLPMLTLKMTGQLQELDGSIVGSGPAEGQLFPR